MKYTTSGGINQLNDIAISPTEAVEGQNFDLGLGNTKFRPRKPFDYLATTTNAGQINGIMQLIKKDNTKTTLIASDTVMYDWDGATTFTSKDTISSLGKYRSFDWTLDDTIIITDNNKANPVLEWDGSTCANLTHGIAGVTNFYAKHGLVANGRAILANVTTDSTENPHLIAFSEYENRQNFDTTTRSGDSGFTTGNEPFYILSPDLKPINGMTKFQDIVIISTENGELFKLVGDDSTNYKFVAFYKGSAAVGDESFINAGNDVYFMKAGGVIESLRSTDTYGDVGTDDISLPVRDITKGLTGFQGVYDQTNRKILFFIGNSVLVLFKDKLGGEESPYSLYKTTHDCDFVTNAATYLEYQSLTDKTVLFGDDSGNIYDLNGVGFGDGGAEDVLTQRKYPLQESNYSSILQGRVFYRRHGACDLGLQFDWGDENSTTNAVINLKGSTGGSDALYFGGENYFGDTIYFGQGLISGGTPVSQGFSVIGKGTSVFVTISITTTEYFEVDYLQI